jgi:hypothetical protein
MPPPVGHTAPELCPFPCGTQFIAFVEDHVTVNCEPSTVTVAGLTETETVGGGGGVTVTVSGVEVIFGLPL